MRNYKVGILGATGAVGKTMIKVIEERNLPVDLRLFASEKSVGKIMKFKNKPIKVEEIKERCFDDLDIVLGALSSSLSKKYLPMIKEANVLYIDNSSAFRLEKDVPLVIPEINKEDAYRHTGIISNPNCVTIIALMALAPIHALSPIKRLVVSTYQAVSGAGSKAMKELYHQHEAHVMHKCGKCQVFDYPIAYNLIPKIGEIDEQGYSEEEKKLYNEGRKILHSSSLQVNCTCVRVPVARCHCESITFELEDDLSTEEIQKALKQAPGIVYDETLNPTPLSWQNQDLIYVGRLRKDYSHEKSYILWCCGDQLRKGAASNAVDIMELFMVS